MKRFVFKTAILAALIGGSLSLAEPAQADRDRGNRNGASSSDNRNNNHDWNKNRHWDKGDKVWQNNNVTVYSQQRRSLNNTYQNTYQVPRGQAVYYAPQTYYGRPYFSQAYPTTRTVVTETYYPPQFYRPSTGYRPTYTVGGYLPRDRNWQPLDYTRYGLGRPNVGQRWVYADRDAVLISEATSRIISGFLLAAALQ